MIAHIVVVCFAGVFSLSAAAQENRLGRLFYTPEERHKLDQKRGVVERDSGPQNVIINGMVTRTGRAPILFIDGKEAPSADAGGNRSAQFSQGVQLKTEEGRPISAKPGQVVDLSNGRVMENYQLVPGAITGTASQGEPQSPTGKPDRNGARSNPR